ncbi:MAG: toll/interleukin-1 receptor domain-containing protein [Candidatus Accumulibacter sp.]|nr:toll/interleukin-1 receptor domain-containing protein [Accumulibacter sp.]
MADIFLSYRRGDSQSATGRLADRLIEHFGAARVFLDYQSIVSGEDFAEAIRRGIGTSVVVLVVIGPHWLDARNADGQRRLDDPADFVRLEIETALSGGVPIIPVLIEGATMPASTRLPASLQEFSRCQGVELSATRWQYDVDRLIATLQARFAIESDLPSPAVSGISETRINLFARLALDLLELAAHPTRLIARQQTGHALDHVRAFTFLFAALLLGNVAFLLALSTTSLVEWTVAGVILGVMTVTVLATLLAFAWRIVGVRIEFRQVTLILAYVYAGVWIGFCAGALLAVMGVQLIAPDAFTDYLAIMRSEQPFPQRIISARNLLENALHGAAAAMFFIACLIWAATSVWTYVAWGAFRFSFGCSRVKAVMATSLWLAMLLTLGQLTVLVGRGL